MKVKAKIRIGGSEFFFPGTAYKPTGSYLVDRRGVVWVEVQKRNYLFWWKNVGFVCEDNIEFFDFYECGGDVK